ncbi:uncharacterized protein [Procambarus clarkii]|uniref:uncharacterized protein n=1 Tax=Procambarus clarkii TaxID=6728 RepID=UPI003742FC4B
MARKQNQVIVEFIELYRSEPCLWQVKSEEYHDRTKKDVAYSKLVKTLEELEPGATKKSVLRKINSLRSAYRNEKKKVGVSKKSGASTDSIYKQVLWYYDLLEFLQDQDTPRTRK